MINALILAAGSSSRLGQSKQLLRIGGQTLLEKTTRTVAGSGVTKTTVVLGSNEQAHHEAIKDLDVDIASNTTWEQGMGSSIKAGLNDILSRYPDTDAVIIFVCDQPMLSETVIKAMLLAYEQSGKRIVACEYAGTTGVPVLFHKTYFDKLKELADDQGAKTLILKNTPDVATVPFPGGEVDVDTMEQWESVRRES